VKFSAQIWEHISASPILPAVLWFEVLEIPPIYFAEVKWNRDPTGNFEIPI